MSHRASLQARLTTAKANLANVFPNFDNPLSDDGARATALHTRTAPRLRDFFSAIDRALDAVQRGQQEAATALEAKSVYTEQERERRAVAAKTTAAQDYATAYATATTLLDTLVDDFQRSGVPARPQPADAAQEAALTNLRADLRMVLDPTPTDTLANKFRDLYAEALAARDDLRAWFVAGSSWPVDYLTARNATHLLPSLSGKLAEAMADAPERETFRQANTAYAVVEKGPQAVRKVLAFLPYIAREELDVQ